MELKRQQPIVEAYHFDMRDPQNTEAKTKINVGFAPFPAPDENYPKENRLGVEPILPLLIKLSIPSIISMTIQALYK